MILAIFSFDFASNFNYQMEWIKTNYKKRIDCANSHVVQLFYVSVVVTVYRLLQMKILVLLMQTSLTQACLLRLRVACFYRCGLKIIQLLMLSVHLSEIVLIHFNVSFVLYLFQILFICGGKKSPFILRSFPFFKIFNFYSRYYFH